MKFLAFLTQLSAMHFDASASNEVCSNFKRTLFVVRGSLVHSTKVQHQSGYEMQNIVHLLFLGQNL